MIPICLLNNNVTIINITKSVYSNEAKVVMYTESPIAFVGISVKKLVCKAKACRQKSWGASHFGCLLWSVALCCTDAVKHTSFHTCCYQGTGAVM